MTRPDPRLAALGIDAAVPFRVATSTRFRGVDHRDGWLLRGSAGWAEFSPFPEYPPEVAARWLRGALDAALNAPPPPVRTSIEVNVTVPAVDPDAAAVRVRGSGCRTAKVKVAEPGQGLAADVARVAAVRAALGPGGRIRVDANAAWDVPTAALALDRLDAAAGGLEYAEQPCRDLDELRDLRRRTRVPLAADESLRTAGDPRVDLRDVAAGVVGAVDLMVLKVQPLGGPTAALRLAEGIDLPAVVSSALETSIGLAVGRDVALAVPRLAGACGLGTATLLAEDVVDRPIIPTSGVLHPGPRPTPSRAVLDQGEGRLPRAVLDDLSVRLDAALRVLGA